MQTQSAFVRSDRRIELNTVAAVYLYLTVVINPGYAEHDRAFRLNDALDHSHFLKLRIRLYHGI